MSVAAVAQQVPSTDAWRTDRIAGLRAEREEIASSKPNLSGKTWAKYTGAGVLGTAAMMGTMTGVGMLIERSAWYKSLPAYTNPEFKVMGWSMLAGIAALGVAGFAGYHLGNHLSKPGSEESAQIRAQHAADTREQLALIDAQIDALGAN